MGQVGACAALHCLPAGQVSHARDAREWVAAVPALPSVRGKGARNGVPRRTRPRQMPARVHCWPFHAHRQRNWRRSVLAVPAGKISACEIPAILRHLCSGAVSTEPGCHGMCRNPSTDTGAHSTTHLGTNAGANATALTTLRGGRVGRATARSGEAHGYRGRTDADAHSAVPALPGRPRWC